MLFLAAQILSLNLSESVMAGDKPSDLKAAASAGLPLGVLIAEETGSAIEAIEEDYPGFKVKRASNSESAINAAIDRLLGIDSVAGPAREVQDLTTVGADGHAL